ncbi:MAG: hypothetical protein U0800_14300 [Isosphaeraceae bacterium]
MPRRSPWNALKGRFEDDKGGFTRVGPPDRDLAVRITHDRPYHEAKA